MQALRTGVIFAFTIVLAAQFAVARDDSKHAEHIAWIQSLSIDGAASAPTISPALRQQLQCLSLAIEPNPLGRRRFVIADGSVKGVANAKAMRAHLHNAGKDSEFDAMVDSVCASQESSASNSGLRAIAPSVIPKKGISTFKRESAPYFQLFNWQEGSYTRVSTDHFEIISQRDERVTAELADLCELTYQVWMLVFPDFADGGRANAANLPNQPPRFKVVLFRDQETYGKLLRSLEPNIKVSKGYYNPTGSMSFFFWDGAKTQDTIIHELTHQFFHESPEQKPAIDTDRDPGFWVIEGIAQYMESMSIRSVGGARVVELGGWDSKCLQAGRYRRLHDQYWVEWDEFRGASGKQFRTGPDLSKWYSQACGLTHYWMDGSKEQRAVFYDYMKAVYAGNESAVTELLVKDSDELRTNYDKYLLSTSSIIVQADCRRPYFENRNDVVLSRCAISTADLLAWPLECRKLNWLDLSFTKIGDDLFDASVLPVWKATKLNLESTEITDQALVALNKIEGLMELDLSHCTIGDAGIKHIRGNATIQDLWLTGTKVTDASLDIFMSMPRLRMLEVSETEFSLQAWQKLVSKKPSLKK